MKANALVALAACAALALACSAGAKPPAAGPPAPQTAPPAAAGPAGQQPTNLAEYRELLFVDETLEELANPDKPNPIPAAGPWEGFVRAREAVRAGRAADAKRHLRAALEHPEAEVRTRLWAWNGLRELGERPPAGAGREVRGVVLEMPIGEWVDTLAVYSDGRVRYVNGKRGAIIWEDTAKSDVNALAAEVVRAAAPLVGRSRPVGRHLPLSMSVMRVTVLTFSGMYVAEGDPEAPPDGIVPVFNVGTRLFLTLLEKQREQEQGAPPRPAPDTGEGN